MNTNISITFSEAINTANVTINTDTNCTGSIQVSSDDFTTCQQMSATITASNGDTSFLVTPASNLAASTTYKVKATTAVTDASGNPLTETIISFTTGTVADTTSPTFAGATGATADSSTAITISWNAGSDDTTTSGSLVYDIYQSISTGGQNYTTATATSSAGATSYQVTGLTASTQYFFVVRARDEAGNRDTNTTEVNATTSAAADTTNPTFAGATGATADSSSAIPVSWSAGSEIVTAIGSIVYDIYQASTSGGQNYTSATATSSAGATSHQVTGLTASTQYFFVVRARDEAGNRDSNTVEVNATTPAAAPTLSAGDLVISEVMANPSGTEGDQEYIEIYNAKGSTINFATNNITIDDGGTPTTINSGTVTAGGFFLLCANTNSGLNGGITTCNTTLTFALTNGGETLTIKEGATTIDAFTYNADAGNGKSWELKPTKMTSTDNDDFANNWRTPLFPYGGSGTDDWGTPGSTNSKEVLISEVMHNGGTADDEFIELYNPNAVAINLKDAGYRLERKTSTTGDPSILCRFDTATDFNGDALPTSLSIPANGFYLIVNDNATAATTWKDNADALVKDAVMIITADNVIYLGKDAISGKTDPDILDFVGFGAAADFEGSGAAPALTTNNNSIERKAYSNSTADTNATTGMFTGGGHASKGNSYDTNDNSTDFILRTTADPQNSSATIETP